MGRSRARMVLEVAMARWREQLGEIRSLDGYDRTLARIQLDTEVREAGGREEVVAFALWALQTAELYEVDLGRMAIDHLERRRAVEVLPELRRLDDPVKEVRVGIAALEALERGECSCAVHKHLGDRPGPSMREQGREKRSAQWQVERWGSCELCGVPWRLLRQDQDRGHPVLSWLPG